MTEFDTNCRMFKKDFQTNDCMLKNSNIYFLCNKNSIGCVTQVTKVTETCIDPYKQKIFFPVIHIWDFE